MATWKKVLFDGDAGLNLANANLTADASRVYTLSSGGYLKFQPNGNATDLLNLSSSQAFLGSSVYTGQVGVANNAASLYLLSGIFFSSANSYHLHASPYTEFRADTSDDATGDGSKIIMRRDTNNGVAADDMNVGVIKFQAENDNNSLHEYASIKVNATDVSLNNEESEINFNVYEGGSSTEALSLKPTSEVDKARYGIELYGVPLRRYITPMALPFSYKPTTIFANTTTTVDAYYGGAYAETFVAPKDGAIMALSYSFNRTSSSGDLNFFRCKVRINGSDAITLSSGGNSPTTGLRSSRQTYAIGAQAFFNENDKITVQFEIDNESASQSLALTEMGATVFAEFTEPMG